MHERRQLYDQKVPHLMENFQPKEDYSKKYFELLEQYRRAAEMIVDQGEEIRRLEVQNQWLQAQLEEKKESIRQMMRK